MICHSCPPHALTTGDHRKCCPSSVLPVSEICPQQPGGQGRQTSRCLHPGLFPPVTSGLFLGRGDLLATTTHQLFIRTGKMAPEICPHPAQEGLTSSNDHTPVPHITRACSPHHIEGCGWHVPEGLCCGGGQSRRSGGQVWWDLGPMGLDKALCVAGSC